MFRRDAYLLLVALLSVVVMAGCGGGGDSGSGSTSTARLQVSLTDATGTYASVVLAIKEIRVVPAGKAETDTGPGLPLITSFSPVHSVDVLGSDFQFQQQLLGDATVPVGNYEQVRLVLAPNPASGDPVNYVTLPGDSTKLPLDTPSGQQSGLKIVGKFQVQAGIINAIALDFNPEKAIVTAGNSGKRLLKPTGIRIVKMSAVLSTYGTLVGAVLPSSVWPTATVYITPAGGTTAIAAGSVSPDDGTFRAFLPPGTGYTIRITAPNYNTYDSALLSPPVSYGVAQGVDTLVGTITLNNDGALTGTIMPSAAWPTASVSVLPSGGGAPVATVAVNQTDGTFRALVPPATGYTIQVTATGYVTYDSALLTSPVSWNVTPLTATAVGTITLAP